MFKTKEEKVFTTNIKEKAKKREVIRQTLSTELEALEQITYYRPILRGTPFEIYQEEDSEGTTIILAEREHNGPNGILFNGVDHSRLFISELD